LDDFLPQLGPTGSEGDSRRALAATTAGAPVLINCGDVPPRPPEWLWKGRLPLGKLTLVIVEPHLTPSWLAVELAARTSRAAGWPGDPPATTESPAACGTAVLVTSEVDLPRNVRPRLDAARAEAARVVVLSAVRSPAGHDRFADRPVSLFQDLSIVENAVAQTAECKLLVIDAHMPSSKLVAEPFMPWGSVLATLADLAQRQRAAVVLVVAAPPRQAQQPLAARLAPAAEAVWVVARDLTRPEGWLFVPAKRPCGHPAPALGFERSEGRLLWRNLANGQGTQDFLSAGSEAQRRLERDVAVEWLVEALGAGPMISKELLREARECGLSERTLRRGAAQLGIRPRRREDDGIWEWSLGEGDRVQRQEKGMRGTTPEADFAGRSRGAEVRRGSGAEGMRGGGAAGFS
jgi:putative DNA primase/helicase